MSPETHKALELPGSRLARDADQRAAFGRFFLNAASFPLPPRVERVEADGFELVFFHRAFAGFKSPILTVLAEDVSGQRRNVWAAAPAVLKTLSRRSAADLIKVFIAGSADGSANVAVNAQLDRDWHGAFVPVDKPEVIELTSGYETFLATLGRHTRRDMRSLRRKALSAGYSFQIGPVDHGTAAERRSLGQRAAPKRYGRSEVDSYDTFIAAQPGGFGSTLRSASGEFLSYCSGVISDRAAILCYQLNDGTYPQASLSLSHRSFLLEHLVNRGIREFISPGGSVGLLARACHFRRGGELILIRRSASALVKSLVVSTIRPYSTVGYATRAILRGGQPA